MYEDDANDFLMGGGYPSAKFPTIGAEIDGIVVGKPRSMQKIDYASKKPQFWQDGKPQMQVAVNLRTNQRDPEIPHDDGVRALYIGSVNMKNAIRTAVRAAGASGLADGGRLRVRYVRDGVATKGNPPKEYEAWYIAPAGNGQDPLMSDPTPAAQVVDASVIPNPPPGIDPVKWRDLPPEQRDRIFTALNNG